MTTHRAVIGRNVHFVRQDGEYEHLAMITGTFTSTQGSDVEPQRETVHLHVFVFDPDDEDIEPVEVEYDVHHDSKNKSGTWHWPDECQRERRRDA